MIEPEHFSFLPVSRRGILAAGAASAAALMGARVGLGGPRVRDDFSSNRPAREPTRRARNVIFMVADGMSIGTLTLGEQMIRRERGREGHWVRLWARPGARRALQWTGCADSLVTDSAAAACAWGIGRHINLGAMNVLPDGEQRLPIMIQARQAGKMTGVVTTTRITHATPAGFYANAPRRDLEAVIAGDLLERGIDVALGGGARNFPDELLAKHADVRVVRNAEELKAASGAGGGRLLGLFDRSHVPFGLDRTPAIPSLPMMTRAALARLEKGPEGFVLQVEGGRVDHAAHNNDAPSLIREQMEFDDTIGAVLEWMDGRDDTLLIVTTDHANANPGLTLYLEEGERGLERVSKATRSFDWMDDRFKKIVKERGSAGLEAELPVIVKEAMGIELSPVHAGLVIESMKESGRRCEAFDQAGKWWSVLGAALANHFAIAFASPHHTADLTEVTAAGPGSELIGALIDNIDLHGVMVSAMGLPAGKLLKGMEERMQPTERPKPD